MKSSKEKEYLAKQRRIIESYKQERDHPAWFRGLSAFQTEAADSLLSCIRDDSQQSTSHRIRDALRRIGIEPPVGPSKIKLVMRLSGGNDIAFLWFLMELYYRGPGGDGDPPTYSVNEQIFLTVIAYLDTIPTLRVLDRILPKKLPKVKIKKPEPVKKKPKSKSCFPYFQKQPRPIVYGKTLTMKKAPNVANLTEFEHGLAPYFCVLNENSRWFAKYEFQKGKRVARGIIDSKIDEFIEEHLIENRTACEHHQNLEALKESMKNARIVAKQLDCAKYFDVEAYFKNQSYKRVMGQLNNEIEKITMTRLEATKRGQSNNTCINEVQAKVDQNLFDFGLNTAIDTKCALFKAPTANTPYKFNYDKIFDMGCKDPVKDAITSALNEGSSDNEIDRCQAVKKICKKLWSEEVEAHNLKYEKEQKALKAIVTKQYEHEHEEIGDNPSDKVISQILMKGLAELRKDKKFVLATLPDAHKWSALRQWTRRRYGKYFSVEEKIKDFQNTKRVFHALGKIGIDVPCPRLDELAQRRMLSYGCRDYILKKTNFLREAYQNNFKDRFLEDVRVYWAAVRPYQCSRGPPRNVFFAYLPARRNDIHLFRPWKKYEFIHAKAEWDKRQRIKRSEQLF